PPQLLSPWRVKPLMAARSPNNDSGSSTTASPWRAEVSAIWSPTASKTVTTPAGTARAGPSALPVSAMAPLAAHARTVLCIALDILAADDVPGPSIGLARSPLDPDDVARAAELDVVLADATRRVTLSRPDVHNAFNARMREELLDALAVAAADPSITSVVLDGDGPSFCSGGDLDEFGTAPDPATAHLVRVARSAGAA